MSPAGDRLVCPHRGRLVCPHRGRLFNLEFNFLSCISANVGLSTLRPVKKKETMNNEKNEFKVRIKDAEPPFEDWKEYNTIEFKDEPGVIYYTLKGCLNYLKKSEQKCKDTGKYNDLYLAQVWSMIRGAVEKKFQEKGITLQERNGFEGAVKQSFRELQPFASKYAETRDRFLNVSEKFLPEIKEETEQPSQFHSIPRREEGEEYRRKVYKDVLSRFPLGGKTDEEKRKYYDEVNAYLREVCTNNDRFALIQSLF